MERLDKLLASQGLGTRSGVQKLIRGGGVTVDGAAVRDPSAKCDPERQALTVGGRPLGYKKHLYVMLNKPAGILCVSRDPKAATVVDLLPPALRRRGMFPAGRLDKDTEGLLLLTNDGPLAHRLLSPRRHVDKTYFVRADRPFDGADEAAFAAGMVLRDGLHCLPARLERLDCPEEALVTIQEGKYHQIKRMVASQYKQVVYLKRLSMGALKLDPALEKGAWRYLTPAECAALRDAGD